jgi:outer membrane immunogenic protein
MKKLALAGAALVSLSTAVFAADLPTTTPNYKAPAASAAYNWTGFYLGGNAGYGWGKVDNNVSILDALGGITGVDNFTASGNLGGWLGGIQAGYNWQTGSMVLGVEVDFDLGSIKGDSFVAPLTNHGGPPYPPVYVGSYYQDHEQIKWFGTARGRVGFTPTNQWLIYATGGLAFARVDYSAATSFPAVQYAASETATKSGWTLGAGTELAIGNNWSTKVEYLYYDLGSKTLIATTPLTTQYTVQTDFATRGNLVRVGLNKKI